MGAGLVLAGYKEEIVVFLLVSWMLKAIYLASLLCGSCVTSGSLYRGRSSIALCTVPVPGGLCQVPWCHPCAPMCPLERWLPGVVLGALPGSSRDEQNTPRAAPARTGNACGRATGTGVSPSPAAPAWRRQPQGAGLPACI